MQRLADQVAIVTGGAQGIGGATARRLAEEGARVLIVDVDGPELERNLQRITSTGGVAASLVADIGTLEGIEAMVAHAVERWGTLNIVVNNAYGPFEQGDALSTSEESWDRGMTVGLKAMFRVAKLAIPHMRSA